MNREQVTTALKMKPDKTFGPELMEKYAYIYQEYDVIYTKQNLGIEQESHFRFAVSFHKLSEKSDFIVREICLKEYGGGDAQTWYYPVSRTDVRNIPSNADARNPRAMGCDGLPLPERTDAVNKRFANPYFYK